MSLNTFSTKSRIKKRTNPNDFIRQGDLPDHMVEIVSSFKLEDSWVCGIAPMDAKLMALLTVPKDEQGKVEMLVVEALEDDFNYISTDVLAIEGERELPSGKEDNDTITNSPQNYNLEYLLADQQYYVVSPNEVVIGKPRDTDDHIDWLIDRKRFPDALSSAEQNPRLLRRYSAIEIGRRYLDDLLENLAFTEAAKLCVRVFKNDKRLWQEEAVMKSKIL